MMNVAVDVNMDAGDEKSHYLEKLQNKHIFTLEKLQKYH